MFCSKQNECQNENERRKTQRTTHTETAKMKETTIHEN